MDEQIFRARFSALLEGINGLPAPTRARLAEAAGMDASAGVDLTHCLNEAMDGLRLGMAYLVFDLEATRRENRYLRRLLEAQARAHTDSQDEDDPEL